MSTNKPIVQDACAGLLACCDDPPRSLGLQQTEIVIRQRCRFFHISESGHQVLVSRDGAPLIAKFSMAHKVCTP